MSPQSSSAGPFSVTLRDVCVSRADRPILVDVNLTVTERARAAVIGPNGVGKSTLLRVMAGLISPDSGSVDIAPGRATVGLLEQELTTGQPSDGPGTVRALVAARLGVSQAEAELNDAAKSLADFDPDHPGSDRGAGSNTGSASDLGPPERYERALDLYLALGAPDLDVRLEQVAEDLGLPLGLLEADPATLSGGEAERVGLAMVMLSRFDLTLLDEPTNNLDLDGLERLERWVADHRGGLIMVSHDRAFLERAVSTVFEIDHHQHTVNEFNGGWQAFLDERAAAAALAQQRYSGYITERDRLAERSQQQREWAAKGASRVRKHPADGDKFRRNWQLAQTEKLLGKAKATKTALERLEVVDKPWEPWDLRFTIDRAPRSANVVAAADRAVLQRGDFTLGPIDLEIRWADRVAIVGPNGSGKSTLLDALLGRLIPSTGEVKLGSGVIVGELDQRREGLAPSPDGGTGGGRPDDGSATEGQPAGVGASAQTLLRAFQDAGGLVVDEARSVLAKFGLDAEAVSRPASSLSPGERTRAQLALFQATGVNLLVLDEPTNHLDMPAIEQLESALSNFDGTLILVTHDRRLLSNVSLTRTVDLGSFRSGDLDNRLGGHLAGDLEDEL